MEIALEDANGSITSQDYELPRRARRDVALESATTIMPKRRIHVGRNVWLVESLVESRFRYPADFLGRELRPLFVVYADDATVQHADSLSRRRSEPLGEQFSHVDVGVQVRTLVGRSIHESFGELGPVSDFTRALDELMAIDSARTLTELDAALWGIEADEIVGEALRWVGAVDHRQSWGQRRRILESRLASASSRVRYVAAMGLAKMDDPTALPVLLAALHRESYDRLRYHLQRVIDQLRETQRIGAPPR